MAAYLPPGWPAGVHPPGTEGFERTAVAWLLDVVPPDFRLYGVLRRHPVALATMAKHHVAACVEGARDGYRTARTELGGELPPPGVEAVLAAYRKEGKRLVGTASAVDLILQALRAEAQQAQAQQAQAQQAQTRQAGETQQGDTPRRTTARGTTPRSEKVPRSEKTPRAEKSQPAEKTQRGGRARRGEAAGTR